MRHNQNRRSRGRNNRKGPNPLTRSYESNGPDVKVRGTAAHVAEKYMSLARDAQASGDPVAAENYLQHAEHYNRIVMAAQAQFQQQPQFREGGSEEFYDDDRQMNGRPRFEFNGDGRPGGEEDGDERFDAGEGGEEDRGFRPPMQSRPYDQDQRGPRGPRNDRFDRRDRDRDRQDRFDRGDRPDYRGEGGGRPERFQRAEEPQPEAVAAPAPPPVEEAAPAPRSEEAPPPRRRRGRPRQDEQVADDGATTDGAAALAAFPD